MCFKIHNLHRGVPENETFREKFLLYIAKMNFVIGSENGAEFREKKYAIISQNKYFRNFLANDFSHKTDECKKMRVLM